jgi:hypothetical protein
MAAVAFLCTTAGLVGATFYVDPSGSDRAAGTRERPWASLAGARDGVRASQARGREPVEVILRAGVYYLSDTVVFSSEDSGTPTAPVSYRAEEGAEVTISGGRKLALAWKAEANGVYSAQVPADLTMDQLFADGVSQRMARYPNYGPAVAVYGGFAADAFSAARAERWSDPAGGFIHAMHRHLWGGYHYRITGRKPDGTIAYEGGWQNNRQMGMHNRYRFVENIREELDAPGEWFHDRKTNQLLFLPPAGLDLARATIEVATLKGLIDVRGTREKPVRFLRFVGFTFRHAERTFMETKEPLLRSDWSIYRGGALRFEGAEDCSVDGCTFDQLGGNAVFVNDYNRRVTIRGAWIRECGGNGVAFVGNPKAVKNPIFEYEQRAEYAALDRTPGPQTDDYPADCAVEDCLITRIGRVEKQVAGVQISMARRITVRHCSIYEVPRSGINISEGTWGGHLIEGCDVFETVLETGDHGSFNSWGRDRFWEPRGVPEAEVPELALLDAIEPVVIRDSRWRCDHGWDIDLDDGSSNYHIYNNLMLGGGLKLREGFRRQVWNNVIVNNSLHPHVWYPNSGDTFVRNIVMTRYRPARMGAGKWGRELDFNLFTSSEADRTAFAAHGADAHSAVGKANFLNPAAGDFRVADDSPALALGFRNFPMDRFGVREPRLRAVARTPEIPGLQLLSWSSSSPACQWLGAEIRNLEGEEYSAVGLSAEMGGVLVIDAPGHAEAVQLGLRVGDVIVSVNGAPAKTVDELAKRIADSPGSTPVRLGLRRDQKDREVALPSRPRPPVQRKN